MQLKKSNSVFNDIDNRSIDREGELYTKTRISPKAFERAKSLGNKDRFKSQIRGFLIEKPLNAVKTKINEEIEFNKRIGQAKKEAYNRERLRMAKREGISKARGKLNLKNSSSNNSYGSNYSLPDYSFDSALNLSKNNKKNNREGWF